MHVIHWRGARAFTYMCAYVQLAADAMFVGMEAVQLRFFEKLWRLELEVLLLFPDEICDLLSSKLPAVIIPDTLAAFKTNKISGEVFLDLNEEDIKE